MLKKIKKIEVLVYDYMIGDFRINMIFLISNYIGEVIFMYNIG